MIIRSSMMGTFKSCPTKYKYIYVDGLRRAKPDNEAENPHLYFGSALHKAIELYHQEGKEAADKVWVEYDKRCATAKKNPRIGKSLMRRYAENPLEPICLEKDFQFNIGNHVWQGRFDMIVEYGGMKMVVDHKTTSFGFDQLKPNDQFTAYYLGAKIYYKDIEGVIVQVLNVSNGKIDRLIINYSEAEIEEWREETKLMLAHITRCTNSGVFPKSKTCSYWGKACQFKILCTSPPAARERWAQTQFNRIDDPTNY